MVPFCKKIGVKLSIELHHPHYPRHELWKEYIRICREEGEGWLWIVPDFGIFINTPHKLWCDQAIEMGFRPEVFAKLVELHRQRISLDEALQKLELTATEKEIARSMYEEFQVRCQPEEIRGIVDVACYMHGKFYYAEEGKNDESIPYDEILRAIASTDYDGYIACEYEGHHFTDKIPAKDQLSRYVSMCRLILD